MLIGDDLPEVARVFEDKLEIAQGRGVVTHTLKDRRRVIPFPLRRAAPNDYLACSVDFWMVVRR